MNDDLNEKTVQAIIYGHSCALRLKLRLDDPTTDVDGSVSSYDLAKSIVDCFSIAISTLRDSSPSHIQIMSHSKKRKISSTSLSENWRDDSPAPIYYDGYLWRKYGQKNIKKSGYERSYYRCNSHNKDHYCEAKKHEQKIKDNPPVYRTTYFGHHACKINNNQDAITVVDPVDDMKSGRMIRFGKDLDDQEKENQLNELYSPVKHEEEEDLIMMRKERIDQDSSTSSADSCLLSSLSGSESYVDDSELIWNNLGYWDPYDRFDFGVR